MSYKDFQAFTTENCRGYKKIYEISIGGFLYLAFLPDAYHKILCISSDYMSIIDSENGKVTPIDGDYDEIELVAMCEGYDSPIQYETAVEMKTRFLECMVKYREHQTVVVIAHQMLIRQFVANEKIDFCQVIECEIEI